MPSTVLLEKLIDIERSIGTETNDAVRSKLMDLQDHLVLMEKARVQAYRAALEPCGIRKLLSHIYPRT